MKRFRINADALGVCASTICIIHCLAFPLLLALLSAGKLTAEEGATSAEETFASLESHAMVSAQEADHCTEHKCCTADSAVGAEANDEEGAACCSTPISVPVGVSMCTG